MRIDRVAFAAALARADLTCKQLAERSGVIKEKLVGMWNGIKSWWSSPNGPGKFLTLNYWKGIGENILNGLFGGLKSVWDSIKNWVIDKVQWITDKFSVASRSSSGAFGSTASGSFGGTSRMAIQSLPSIAPASIPALAQGAVIPPNREFLAVLGDQTSGNNLETPESLLRKIVREESGGGNAELVQMLQSILAAIKAGHIIMVDGTVFGRTAIKTINGVNTTAGKQMLLI